MKKHLLAIVLMLGILASGMLAASSAMALQVFEKKADNFVVLFDLSGSMDAKFEDTGKTKKEVARDLLHAMNNDIPPLGYNSALYVFTPWTKLYGMKPYNKGEFGTAIDAIDVAKEPGAFKTPTPLGKAMDELRMNVLKGVKGRTVVYLFSDGRNTDDYDAVERAKMVANEHDVCFLVISTADTKEGKAVLEGISKASKCSKMVDFDYAVKNPEVCTGELCSVKFVPTGEGAAMVPGETPYEPVELLLFDFDKSELTPVSKILLDHVAAYLKDNPKASVFFGGYTDSIGTDAYNKKLSERRAMAATKYLTDKGIAKDRVITRWYGEKAPIFSNANRHGRAMNRRVEVIVMDGK